MVGWGDGEMQPHISQIWTLYFRTKILCFYLLPVKVNDEGFESKKVLGGQLTQNIKYKPLNSDRTLYKLPRLSTWSFYVIYVLY